MDDDNKPIDASIRPVLPSRQNLPTQDHLWQGRDPEASPLPPKPARTRREKPVKKPVKSKKRSTIAKAAWQTRRKNAGKSPLLAMPYGVEGAHFATAISAMMKLKPAQRTLVMQILQSLAP